MRIALLFFLLAAPAKSRPDAGTALSAGALKHPVQVHSDNLEILGKKNQAIWSGHVKAKRGTTDLSCDRLVAFYESEEEIRRLECRGHVEVVDRNRRVTGGFADFDNVTGIVDVTESPEAWQGKNHMTGDKVSFNISDDVIHVTHPQAEFDSQETLPQRPKKAATP